MPLSTGDDISSIKYRQVHLLLSIYVRPKKPVTLFVFTQVRLAVVVTGSHVHRQDIPQSLAHIPWLEELQHQTTTFAVLPTTARAARVAGQLCSYTP